jgi:DNA mismatch repair protein MutL
MTSSAKASCTQERSIAVLPPDVAAKIAAGEVIERPASIVKELLENAIDAGAARIAVEIEAGGVNLIRVSDDGCGLTAGEIPSAFMRHATSKLRRPEDLAAIATLGFRGEALPSIAAAAEVEFASRTVGAASGGRAVLKNGALRDQGAYGGARGTTVTVRDLFESQPARRKFLRSPASESAQIASSVGLYAIAYPEIAFTLISDGRRSLTTTGSGDRREATARVYSAETAAGLLEIANTNATIEAAAISGLVSPPGLTRANRGYIHCFVNRRWVLPRRLTFAIEAAYESLLPTGRHPIAIIDIRVPPEEVDVNVHPTKSEVRFLREREVHAAVYHAVHGRLATVTPATTFRGGASPFHPEGTGGPPGAAMPMWRALTGPAIDDPSPAALLRQAGIGLEHGRSIETPRSAGPEDRPALPILRVVGQSGSLYIVAEGWDGMYLLDQHASHERVLYEQLQRQKSGGAPEIQGLLSPIPVELTAVQDAALVLHAGALREHGFELEPFGPRSYLIRSVPAMLGKRDAAKTLSDLLDDLEDGGTSADRPSLVTMTVACHASIRAGKTLAMEEMRELLRLLEACEHPRTCPHGRPTMIHLSNEALEREFRRR